MLDNSCVYWIHLPEHTDMFSQGYIGVSKNGAEQRFKRHLEEVRAGSSLTVHNAIRKHGCNLIVETILRADFDYCLSVEYNLRPFPNIGYNIAVGGKCPRMGVKHSEESKKKISESGKGRVPSEQARTNMSKAQKGRVLPEEVKQKMKVAKAGKRPSAATIAASKEYRKNLMPWEIGTSDKVTWLNATAIYQTMLDNPEMGTVNLSKLLQSTPAKLLVIYKKIKSGWNPNTDESWLVFSSKLIPDASGDKSLPTGTMPN